VIPIHDDNPTRTVPVVTYALIAANVVVFLWQQAAGDTVIVQYALFPFRITGADPEIASRYVRQLAAAAQQYGFQPAWATIFTAMFLHGSWMHLIGNMVFLAIFGNNIEDVLGKFRYLLFYLFCGAVAAGAHLLTAWNSATPTLGASGAIAGVLGAYYVLYPRARVTCLIFFILITVIDLPAGMVLGFWFVLQFIEGVLGWGALHHGAASGGVAYAAHVGGFIAGYLLMKFFNPLPPARPRYYPQPDQADWR